MAKQKNTSWLDDEEEVSIEVQDCNGIPLDNGDSVIATKDIKVKGASDIKR